MTGWMIGEGTKIDVSQAEARLAQGTASYQAAVTSLQTSQASFERYVGAQAEEPVGEISKLGKLMPEERRCRDCRGAASHPAVRMAKAGIRAAQAASESAAAAFGPTLDFIASIGSTVIGASPPQSSAGRHRLGPAEPVGADLFGRPQWAPICARPISTQIKSEVDALAARDQIKEAVISAWSALQNATRSDHVGRKRRSRRANCRFRA